MNRLGLVLVLLIGALNTYGMESQLAQSHASASNTQANEYAYKVTETYKHPGTFFAAISPDNRTLVSLADDKSIMIKSLTKLLSTTIDHYPWVLKRAVFSSDSSKIAIGLDQDRREPKKNSQGCFVLDVKKDCTYQRYLKNDVCEFLMFTPDNNKIIAAINSVFVFGDRTVEHTTNKIKIVNYVTGDIEHIIEDQERVHSTQLGDDKEYTFFSQCFIKDSILFALLNNGRAKRIDLNAYHNTLPDITYSQVKTDKLLETIQADGCKWMNIQRAVTSHNRIAIVCHDPDARQYRKEFDNYHDFKCVERSMDSIRVHDINTGDIIATLSLYKDKLNSIQSIALSPSGKTLAFLAYNKGWKICVADVENNNIIMGDYDSDLIYGMTFSSDNRYILVIPDRSTMAVYDARTGKNVSQITHIPAMGQFFTGGTKLCCVGTPYHLLTEAVRAETKKNEIIIAQLVATYTQNQHQKSSCVIS